LRDDVQAADRALAQEIALQTSLQLRDAGRSLVELGQLATQARTPAALANTFHAFQAARGDIDDVYWIGLVGDLRASWPPNTAAIGTEFSPPNIAQQALLASGPVFDVGIAAEPTFSAGVIIADPVRDARGRLDGIIATNLSLADLSEPLTAVIQEQQRRGRHLLISVIDNRGELIATPNRAQLLWTVLNELPGADQALHGHVASRLGPGPDGRGWLFSAVPVPDAGWAVVVQRPAAEALAVVAQLHFWLFMAALLFTIGGLLFRLILLARVICPLHALASIRRCRPRSNLSLEPQGHWPRAPTRLATWHVHWCG